MSRTETSTSLTETREEHWQAMLETQGDFGSIAELLPEVVEQLGRALRADPRPSVVDVALVVGDAQRLVKLLGEHVGALVGNVREMT